MNIKRSSWIILTAAAAISFIIWWQFSYPQLAFTNFTIDRSQAISIAESHLQNDLKVDTSAFHKAAVFHTDEEANRFLQRSIGFNGLTQFIAQEDFDMFYWIVRFFQEGEKEEYRIFISSATGETIAYRHILEDTHAIEIIEDREDGKRRAIKFLGDRYGFDPDEHYIKGDLQRNYDYRKDYSFSWRKKSVVITWSDDPNAGYGKLLTAAKVSGDQMISYSKNSFFVPDLFKREIERLKNTGNNLTTLFRVFYFLLFFASIYYVIVRRNHLTMHVSKNFYIGVVAISFLLSLLTSLNQMQSFFFDYKTASPLFDYLLRISIDTVFYGLFISVTILMPSLSGELLHHEQLPNNKEGTFLYYIRTTFFSRHCAQLITLGYIAGIIMLGIQAFLIEIGQRHWGVWTEYTWITQMTTAYVPILAAFTIAFKASFMEELMHRMFAISLCKKFFKSMVAAVIVSSLIWGFGHSGYSVFPMWFRGVEVTLLGIFLSFIYLQYGIIPVIIAHYLFDVFWGVAGYLLGQTNPVYFTSALCLLLLPALIALIALILNKQEQERELKWSLNSHQKYNLEVLKTYLKANWDHFGRMEKDAIAGELTRNYWDPGVVDIAIDQVEQEKGMG